MKLYLITWLITLPVYSYSQLRLAGIFSDNMVLQRNKPIQIWGKALPGKQVTVKFANRIAAVKTNPDSNWRVSIESQPENSKPQALTIHAENEQLILHNILIGDVWICIGQSNMEWPMQREMHFEKEMKNSSHQMLRFFNPAYAGKNIYAAAFTDSIIQGLHPAHFYRGSWKQCDSNSLKTMSAVAYYFGKSIIKEINVPIGLVNLAIGGAPLETFIDPIALQHSKQFNVKVNGDWLQNSAIPVWVRERGQQNVGSNANIPADMLGRNHAFKPGFAYKSGIEPLHYMPITGIINYQGESNAQETDRVNEYAALSALMVNDYRKKWKQNKLPFYFVQLSSIDTAKYKSQLWPQFRNEQRKMLKLIRYSGMAVCSDIGARDDVHPTNKKEVGVRLAKWALNKTYGLSITPSGPLPIRAKYKKGGVVVTFQYAAKGLMTPNNQPVKGFSTDGETDASARIEQEKLIIHSNKKPAFIYYGWKPFTDANLTNSENLPASAFKIKVR